MSDPWEDEGFSTGEDDWGAGEESLDLDVEEGFLPPEELEGSSWDELEDEE